MASVRRSALGQLKNKSAGDWTKALKRDGWSEENRQGATAAL